MPSVFSPSVVFGYILLRYHRITSPINPRARLLGGRCSFTFAEYIARPAAVVHAGLSNSSGHFAIPCARP